MSTKIDFKIIFRWLARHYDKDAEEAVFNIEKTVDQFRKQLPEGMEHCTIIFEGCEKGHGHLRGTNWIKHPCSTCRIEKLENTIRGALDAIEKYPGRQHPLTASEVLLRCVLPVNK